MIKGIAIFLFFTIFISCKNEKENVDGGPCSYKETIIPAEVVKFEKFEQNFYDIIFVLEHSGDTPTSYDTVRYYSQKHNYITMEEIIKQGIKMGDQYKYVIQEITSGSCTPTIRTLEMEKFK